MKRILPIVLSAILMTGVLAGCSNEAAPEITLYDGINSEMQLIHKMVEILVEDKTDAEVTIKDQMSAVNMFRELTRKEPSCDIMNSYDGTVLTTFLKQDPSNVPEGQTLYDYAKQQVQNQYQVDMLDQLGINNTYCIAVPQAIADQYGLETISDLIPVAGELRFGAEHEFFTAEGTMKYGPFTQFYGLNFKEKIPVDINLKYAAVENGSFEVTVVYTTDGLNRKAGLKVLEDDLGFFPEYNGALLVRDGLYDEVSETAPNLREVLNQLAGTLTNETMTDLTYTVDVEGRTVEEVAREFLTESGLIG